MISRFFANMDAESKKRWLLGNVDKKETLSVAKELGIDVTEATTKKELVENHLDEIFDFVAKRRSDMAMESMRRIVVTYNGHTYNAHVSNLKPCLGMDVYCMQTQKFFGAKNKVCPHCGKKWRPKNPKTDKDVEF